MNCDLKSIYSSLAEKVINCANEDSKIIFNSEILPAIPAVLETDRLFIRKATHCYGSYRIDSLWFFAHKETYLYLGLAIMSVLFHKEPSQVLIKLIHSKTDIVTLIIENNFKEMDELKEGFHTLPYAYVYWPDQHIDKHPLLYITDINALPSLSLTNEHDCMITEDHWQNRDTVKINGNNEGNAAFADILLTFGLPQCISNEIELESECGFRGVARGSCEVQLFLPGHVAWSDWDWQ